MGQGERGAAPNQQKIKQTSKQTVFYLENQAAYANCAQSQYRYSGMPYKANPLLENTPPPVKCVAWLPVGSNSNKTERSSVLLI